MSENRMEYNVNVTDNGSVARSVKSIRGYSKEVAQAEGNTRRASTATGELNYKLNQGVTGTSSAARSFSKLNQAIGHGPNSPGWCICYVSRQHILLLLRLLLL